MTFIDWFAGVGGFRRGMELSGHKCIGFCEYDKFATASYTSMHLITAEQREKLAAMDLKKRQKEILKEEYCNGEWYRNDIRSVRADDVPRAECWCFGAPCQSFSIAGKREGLDGESGLIKEIFRLLGELAEEDRPEFLIYENVKGMLSSSRGFDFLRILYEMGGYGYDVQWQLFNTKNFGIPQNRERVYTIGHLRRCSRCEIFPLIGAGAENCNGGVVQIGQANRPGRDNLNQYRVYAESGVCPCLNKMDGGGREPHIAVGMKPTVIGGIGEKNYGKQYREGNRIYDGTKIATALKASNVGNAGGTTNLYGVPFGIDYNVREKKRDIANTLKARYDSGVSNQQQTGTAVCIPVLTPDRLEKRQNGRRMKDSGEEMFTLTAQDRHGVAVGFVNPDNDGNCRTLKAQMSKNSAANYKRQDGTGASAVGVVWYEKEQCYIAIRKLTPRECFRLQGWTDDYFEKAAFVNSDSQLYKQAGNGVTVAVVEEIAKHLGGNNNEIN